MEAVIRFFDKVAFVALVCMLFVVVASVLGRLVFDLSGGELQWVIPGSVELASYSLLMMVFASLPRAATHGLVSVELLIDKFPDCVKRGLERVWHLLLAAFAAVVGWLFFGTMEEMIGAIAPRIWAFRCTCFMAPWRYVAVPLCLPDSGSRCARNALFPITTNRKVIRWILL